MNVHVAGGTLIIGALLTIAPPSVRCLAQSDSAKASAPRSVNADTTRASPKHRYWRFRGGTHPHYGSRRVRT